MKERAYVEIHELLIFRFYSNFFHFCNEMSHSLLARRKMIKLDADNYEPKINTLALDFYDNNILFNRKKLILFKNKARRLSLLCDYLFKRKE